MLRWFITHSIGLKHVGSQLNGRLAGELLVRRAPPFNWHRLRLGCLASAPPPPPAKRAARCGERKVSGRSRHKVVRIFATAWTFRALLYGPEIIYIATGQRARRPYPEIPKTLSTLKTFNSNQVQSTIVPKGIVRFRSCNKAAVNVFPHRAEPSCATRTGHYLLRR